WRLLLDAGWAGSKQLRALSGGEALPPALARELLSLCAEVWNLYGPTETTIWSMIQRVSEGPITLGRPIAETQIFLLDEHLNQVPVGEPGELCIGGAGLARGYINRPELTAERFIANPFSQEPGARLYRTGDLARSRSDGEIEILGRTDRQVKLRGYRIELGEIESVLSEHAALSEAAVLAPETSSGE